MAAPRSEQPPADQPPPHGGERSRVPDPWSPAPRAGADQPPPGGGLELPGMRPAGGDEPPPRRRGRRLRWLLALVAAAVAAVVLAVILVPTAGYRYAEGIMDASRKPVPAVTEAEPGKPVNVLLVGSDTRAGQDGAQVADAAEGGGQRADTIMIAHVSPERGDVVMLSIPRDLKVELDGRDSKINAALNQGPDELVQVVEQLTGIDLNHYVEIDFSGFVTLVDALGGVRLCNETGKRIDDPWTKLRMEPGCSTLNGPQALSFVRVRKIDSDFQRIQRQQQFLREVLHSLTSAENVLNLPKLSRVGRDLGKHLQTDEGLSVRDGLDLARKLGSLSGDDLDMRTYPSRAEPPSCSGCPAYVVALPDARELTEAIQADAADLPEIGLPGQGAGTEDGR